MLLRNRALEPASWIRLVLTPSGELAAPLAKPRARRSDEHRRNSFIAFPVMLLTEPLLSNSLLPAAQSFLIHQLILLWPTLSVLGWPTTAESAAFSFLFLVTFELVIIIVDLRIMVGSEQKKAIDSAVSKAAVLIVFHICCLAFVQPLVYFAYYACWLATCRDYQGSLGFSPHRSIQCRGAAASQSLGLSFDGEAAWRLTPLRNLEH